MILCDVHLAFANPRDVLCAIFAEILPPHSCDVTALQLANIEKKYQRQICAKSGFIVSKEGAIVVFFPSGRRRLAVGAKGCSTNPMGSILRP